MSYNNRVKNYLALAQDADLPKNETIEKHREHCQAKKGNCPFEQELDKTDWNVLESQKNNCHNTSNINLVETCVSANSDGSISFPWKNMKEGDRFRLPNGSVAHAYKIPGLGLTVGVSPDDRVLKIGDRVIDKFGHEYKVVEAISHEGYEYDSYDLVDDNNRHMSLVHSWNSKPLSDWK